MRITYRNIELVENCKHYCQCADCILKYRCITEGSPLVLDNANEAVEAVKYIYRNRPTLRDYRIITVTYADFRITLEEAYKAMNRLKGISI